MVVVGHDGPEQQGCGAQPPERLSRIRQLDPGIGTPTGPPQPLAELQTGPGVAEGTAGRPGHLQSQPEPLLRLGSGGEQRPAETYPGDGPRCTGVPGPLLQHPHLRLGCLRLTGLQRGFDGVGGGEEREGGVRGVMARL